MDDYLAIAKRVTNQQHEELIVKVARNLHYNESMHMHTYDVEEVNHGACPYCLMRAGQAVRALIDLARESSETVADLSDLVAVTYAPSTIGYL